VNRFSYFALAGFVALLTVLLLTTGDWVGALWSSAVLVLALTLLLAVAGYLVSNLPAWLRRARGISREDHLKQLEGEGKALREHYRTDRAVTFQHLNTSSLVHLIDIGDRRLLCLHGQDYFEFEPIEDDPDLILGWR
jgi:hypothetical protein